MAAGLWAVVGWMAFVVVTGIAFMIWAWRHGQFEDIEAPKYRMMEDREPQPWTDRKGNNP